MPSALTERVRQQAKARTSRVRVVRKAAVSNSSVQTASLDFESFRRQSGQDVLQPKSVNGITAAFQLSWPPPGAMATAVGLVDMAGCNLGSSGKHPDLLALSRMPCILASFHECRQQIPFKLTPSQHSLHCCSVLEPHSEELRCALPWHACCAVLH